MMKKAVDRFWGLLPFLIFLFCIVFVRLVETVTENTLRILPRNLLICFGMISIGILLLWLNTRKTISVHRIFSFALKIVSIFLIAAVTLTGLSWDFHIVQNTLLPKMESRWWQVFTVFWMSRWNIMRIKTGSFMVSNSVMSITEAAARTRSPKNQNRTPFVLLFMISMDT